MPKVISERAFKMSFLQTVPGKEFFVAEQIRAKCAQNKLTDFAILKGLGCYDIIFIYASERGYDSILTKTGPIRGIVRTSRFFCFQYLINDETDDNFFKIIASSTFTSISLIKINPHIENPAEEVKGVIDGCIFGERLNIKSGWVFGTLGWVDLAVIKTSETPKELLEDVLWGSGDQIPSVYKTYSSIAINHDKLPESDIILTDEIKLKQYLAQNEAFKQTIPKEIKAKIAISFDPCQAGLVHKYWSERCYDVAATTGKDDVLVSPPEGFLFSDFISDLLYFRTQHSSWFQTTETKMDICFDIKAEPISQSYETQTTRFIEYTYEEIEFIFNESAAHNLSANINSLNGLLQHRIISDAFLDLSRYFEFVKESGLEIKQSQNSEERIPFANKCSALIKAGAELRLYGTHGTLEDSVGQFTKLRGGIQKSLQAIEYFPSFIISRVTSGNFDWQGFVITGAREFLNLNEVVLVPYESLWKPLTWWPVYHEVAHILINNLKDLINPDHPEIQMFLARKNLKNYWLYLVNEISAEIIGYELGFFGDFNLYMDLVWNYIRELSPKHDNISSISIYLVRTFFVYIYDRLFILDSDSLKQDDLNNLDLMYKLFLKHIESVKNNYFEPHGKGDIFSDMHFIAAENAALPKELFTWMKNRLLETSKKLGFRGSLDLLELDNTELVLKSITDGKRWDGPVVSPEAVLYRLLRTGTISFEQSMSFILTFCNLYYINRI